MATNKNYTGLNKSKVVVPAKSVKEYNIPDAANYFRIQNHSSDFSVYASADHVPSANDYDVKIEPARMKAYGEPYRRKVMYFYNPSTSDITVTVMSFTAEFDPLMIAMSNLEVEVGGTISGEVEVTNMVNYGTDIQLLRQYMANMVGTTTVESQYTLMDLFHVIKDFRKAALGQTGSLKSNYRNGSNFSYTADTGSYVPKIAVLCNDGETDITLSWTGLDAASGSFTVKAGESLDSFNICASAFSVSSGTFRVAYEVRELV